MKRIKRWLALISAAAMAVCSLSTAAAEAAEMDGIVEEQTGEAEIVGELLADFDFNEEVSDGTFISGNVVAASQGTCALQERDEENGTALYLNGSSWLDVKKADGTSLLTGMDEFTVSFDAKPDKTGTAWCFYAAPDTSTQTYAAEYYLGAFINSGALKVERYLNGRTQAVDDISVGNDWNHIDAVFAAAGTQVYVNGILMKAAEGTVSITEILGGSSVFQIGKANWGSGEYFQGWLDNFKIYGNALSAEELVEKDLKTVTLPNSVTADFELPETGKNGCSLTWTVEKNDCITINGNTAEVTRPEGEDVTVIFTVTAVSGEAVMSKDISVTVSAELSDEAIVEKAAENLEIYNADSIMGNITLSEELAVSGSNKKVSVIWTSSDSEVITDKKEGMKDAGVVTRQEKDTQVTLTAVLSCNGVEETKNFEVTVKRKPAAKAKNTSYLFAYFTGSEGKVTDEQIYFSTSLDGCQWTDMTANGNPVLTSEIGDKGVRDPYLIRSAEGDKFYLIATDLSIYYRGGWGKANATTTGSTKLVVWESEDLINWTELRLIDVAGSIPGAGCAWAPEAFYDEETGNYVIYWATASDESNTLGDRMNMYYCTTRDFYTFTEPVIWIDRENSVIDTTMIYDEEKGYYYRASGDGQITIDRSESIYEGWETIGTLKGIFNNNNYSGSKLEGPEFFEYCEDDWLEDEDGNPIRTWGLMCDQYSEGKGYLPFRTTNLDDMSTNSWSAATDVNFGTLKKRHGTILAVTNNEYKAIMEHYGFDASDVPDDPEPDETPTPTVTPSPTATPTPTAAPTLTEAPSHQSHVGETFVVNGLKYKVTKDDENGREVRVTSLKTNTKTLKIPAAVTNAKWKETFKVTSVKAKAFKGKSITKAVIGKNVTKIGPNAFLNCKKLKRVTIGKSVKTIGIRAFYGCKKLTKITIKSTVLKTVKKNAFKKISKKTVVKIPAGKRKAYEKLLKAKTAKGVKFK